MKLRSIRTAVASVTFLTLLLSFIDFRDLIPDHLSRIIASIQFTPALMQSVSGLFTGGIVLVVILLVTALFGRVYCSVLCPLGILQDIMRRVSKPFRKTKHFKYRKPLTTIPFSILGVTLVSYLLGSSLVLNFLDPYSLFGRITNYLFRPVVVVINNVASNLFAYFESYSILYRFEQTLVPMSLLLLTLGILMILAYLASQYGRFFCNTICPVGSLLRIVALFSRNKISFDNEACSKCGKCVKTCKSECISLRDQKVYFDRCVTCYNCIDVCPDNAIGYRRKTRNETLEEKGETKTDTNKRNFVKELGIVTLFCSGVLNQTKAEEAHKKHRCSCSGSDKGKGIVPLKRNAAVAPPGAKSIERFNDLCTGCSLCVTACPNKVLQPALFEYGLAGMIQPRMDYNAGLCNFDCTICSDICPNEALSKITMEEKHVLQIGQAKFVKGNCIVHTDETDCGACSEHCPTKAVCMVPYNNGLVIPQVNQSICVGCGACEFACPVRPNRAIFVDGNEEHLTAEKPKTKKATIDLEEDFPF